MTSGSLPSRAPPEAVADEDGGRQLLLGVKVRPSAGVRPSISNMPGVTAVDEDLLGARRWSSAAPTTKL